MNEGIRGYNDSLASRTEGLVVEIPEPDLDPGAGFDPIPHVMALDCDSDHASAYVLVNYVDENGQGHSGSAFAKSRLLDIELVTGNVTVLSETDLLESPRWIAGSMTVAADRIVTMREFDLQSPLVSVSLTDGSRDELTPGLDVGGIVLTEALDVGRVYVATMEGVNEVDINGQTPTKQNISVVEPNDPLTFSQPRADVAEVQCTKLPQRVIPLEFRVTPAGQLLGADFNSLMQVDRDTGEIVIISK